MVYVPYIISKVLWRYITGCVLFIIIPSGDHRRPQVDDRGDPSTFYSKQSHSSVIAKITTETFGFGLCWYTSHSEGWSKWRVAVERVGHTKWGKEVEVVVVAVAVVVEVVVVVVALVITGDVQWMAMEH